ncbi:hypothetical protein BTA51_00045 [Hahella sp. CCB-MM4]|uniref:hypothetical protein n=1 Tax=Hahella sp. (strain CCB-MM4) TaxID=1926491 RepID=UPI000B9BB02A|nr:hypothetical protein [Hahella sp. CCB-MM4]OZG74842.1 hypothetical protein BTA51_00045 [Hahella sp. CCB-MM4]
MSAKRRIKALEITRTTTSIKLFRELEQVQALHEQYSALVNKIQRIDTEIEYSEIALRKFQTPGAACDINDLILIQGVLKELNFRRNEVAGLMEEMHEALQEHRLDVALLRRRREELDKRKKLVIASEEALRNNKLDTELSELRRSQKL